MRESGARKARMSEGWGVKEIEGNWKIGEGGVRRLFGNQTNLCLLIN